MGIICRWTPEWVALSLGNSLSCSTCGELGDGLTGWLAVSLSHSMYSNELFIFFPRAWAEWKKPCLFGHREVYYPFVQGIYQDTTRIPYGSLLTSKMECNKLFFHCSLLFWCSCWHLHGIGTVQLKRLRSHFALKFPVSSVDSVSHSTLAGLSLSKQQIHPTYAT